MGHSRRLLESSRAPSLTAKLPKANPQVEGVRYGRLELEV